MTFTLNATRRAVRVLVFSSCVLLLLRVTVAAQPAVPANYSVGPQDVLAVAVFDQPNLSGKVTVETDGTFTLPLIGRVTAAGLTLREVESQLRLALEQGYLKNPQVSVSVEQYRSQRVFIVGEVRAPGPYPLSGEMTLIELLARAGSTTERAGNDAVIVRQRGDDASGPAVLDDKDPSRVLRVSLRDLQDGVLAQNVSLRNGDTIFVARAASVYVFGLVRNPGAYTLQNDTTVLQALSLAGGVTERGATNRVRLVRMVGGTKQELKVKLDDRIQPGDTVIVPERFF